MKRNLCGQRSRPVIAHQPRMLRGNSKYQRKDSLSMAGMMAPLDKNVYTSSSLSAFLSNQAITTTS